MGPASGPDPVPESDRFFPTGVFGSSMLGSSPGLVGVISTWTDGSEGCGWRSGWKGGISARAAPAVHARIPTAIKLVHFIEVLPGLAAYQTPRRWSGLPAARDHRAIVRHEAFV